MPQPIHSPNRRGFLKAAGLTGGGLFLASPSTTLAQASDDALRSASWIPVLQQGVIADGKTKNTAILAGLISKLSAAGGGTLYFGSGTYLTGPVHLRSNITLYLDAGAVLRFSDDFDDYLPFVESRFQGIGFSNFSPLIYAREAHNIAIIGRGIIDGQGAKWWDHQLKIRAKTRGAATPPAPDRWQQLTRTANGDAVEQHGFMRPSLIQTLRCSDVLIQGVTLTNSPFWTTHLVESENIVIDGVEVSTPDSPNTDGINPESCRNVRISNCFIHTDDDCITIKAGKNAWGRANASPCENVTITNCVMTSGAGGVGIGSEMSGGVRRVTVSNCVFEGTGHGVHIKSTRGRGGVVEDISVSNIVMHNVHRHPALHLNLKYWTATDPKPVDEGTPSFRNIRFSHIYGTNLQRAIEVSGLEERFIENVVFEDIDLQGTEGVFLSEVEDVRLRDVRIQAASGPILSCRNVRKLQVDGLSRSGGDLSALPIELNDVQHARLTRLLPWENDALLGSVSGAETRDLAVHVPGRSSEALHVSEEVPTGAVQISR